MTRECPVAGCPAREGGFYLGTALCMQSYAGSDLAHAQYQRSLKRQGCLLQEETRGPTVITSESGITAVEFALIASLVAVVIIGVVMTIGAHLCMTFEQHVAPAERLVSVCKPWDWLP